MKRDVQCPYCSDWHYINHDDGYGYSEDEIHSQECESCEKIFTYQTTITFNYYADKADCLNGSEHDYKPTATCPREYTKMRCSMCGEEREPTQQERTEYRIPDKS